MDGAKRKHRPPLEVRREFVGFRLERQVLVRVYELAIPLRENAEIASDSSPAKIVSAKRERVLRPLAKGA